MAYSKSQLDLAKQRLAEARDHVDEAQQQLDAACRDISSIIGALELHRELARLSNAIKEARGNIDLLMYTEVEVAFDREPTDRDFASHAGCGKR